MQMLILFIGIAIVTALAGTVFLLMWMKLEQVPKQAMVSFQLNPEETRKEFEWLYYAHGAEAVVLVTYGIAGIIEHTLLGTISLLFTLIYVLVVVSIYYRWWRRF